MNKLNKLYEKVCMKEGRQDILKKIQFYDDKGGKFTREIDSYLNDHNARNFMDLNETQLNYLLRSLDSLN